MIYYVDINAVQDGNGSESMPFRHIDDAAQVAVPGDEVVVYKYMKDFRVGIIKTETLGKAFEPEERFENPDGSDIVFDRDYLGKHRGLSTMPGPFDEGKTDNIWR